MNSLVLIGRLTKDPEMSYLQNSQTAACKFTIAVDRAKKDETDFIRCTAFGKTAEHTDRYMSKGRQIAVQGRIQTGSYKNRDGVTVYTTDIIADRVEFLGGGKSEAATGNTKFEDVQFEDLPDTFQAAEDDIPF